MHVNSGSAVTSTDSTASASAGASGVGRALTAAIVGTVIEWYDYALYGAASGLIINKLFFPNLSAVNGLLAAFATFAVGFFSRPLGGIVIAHIGDRFGRKPALVLTIVLMGAATVGMGLLPTYSQVGILAPMLLVLMRLVQGFGAGAELAGATVLVAEYTPMRRRAFYTSLPAAAALVGVLLASFAFLAIASVPEEKLLGGGVWRIPFLASAVLFIVALYIRRRLEETPEYVVAQERASERKVHQSVPVADLMRKSPMEVLAGFLTISGQNVNTYLVSAYLLSYMVGHGFTRGDALFAVIVASVFGTIGMPLFGLASDRLGKERIITFGILSSIVVAYPLFWSVDTKSLFWVTAAASACYFFGLGAMAGGQGAFLANLFPTRYRFSGVAMARELNGLAIAGPTPFLAAALARAADGRATLVSAFFVATCVASLIGVAIGRKRSVHE